MTPKDLANKLLDFYQNDPKRWTKGCLARDQDGKELSITNKLSTCWCVLGACTMMHNIDELLAEDRLAGRLGFRNLAYFNDSCKDFEEFKAKLEAIR